MKNGSADDGRGSVGDPQPRTANGGILRALRHRNYRIFFTGAIISNIGGWLAGVARGYLVYELTDSKALLGTLAFASTLPVLLLSPIAGIVADRYYRKPIILTTQSVFIVTNAILAWLIFTGQVQVWQMIALSSVEGIAVAFNSPVYQSLTVEFVGEDDLMNAIALNSLQFNVGRILGSLMGGFVYAWVGPAWSFAYNSASYVAVLAAISRIRIRPPLPSATDRSAYGSFLEGLRYLKRHRDLLAIVWLSATVTVFALPYFALLPVFARDILQGGPKMQAYLLTSVGVGALLAGLRQAVRQDDAGKGRRMLASAVLMAVCLGVFSQSTVIPLSFAALVGVGAFMVTFFTTANTTIQLLVQDEMRGRMMSVFVVASFGLTPIGSLMMGWVAQYLGAPLALLIGAAVSVVGAAAVAFRFPRIRRL